MRWIKYQFVCNENENILLTKKVGYSEANLAIAQKEAYNGYEIIEDAESFEKEPLAVEFGGTGAKTKEAARTNIGAASKFEATVNIGTVWQGNGPYTQNITVPGMLESDKPVIDLLASIDLAAAEAELNAFAMINRIDTINNGIIVYAKEATTQAITIQILGVR